MKALVIIIWLLLGVLYWFLWDRQHVHCCEADTDNTEESIPGTTDESVLRGPLVFSWDSNEPITNDKFPAYKDSIMNLFGELDTMEVLGLFKESETKPQEFDDLGLARANLTRALFEEIPDDRIRFKSESLDADTEFEDGMTFPAATFNIVKGIAKTEADVEKEMPSAPEVIEVDKTYTMYFPSGSAANLDGTKVSGYLDKVAERVLVTGENIEITGHTDSQGSYELNDRLGMQRAQRLKEYLVTKGVSKDLISVYSKGEIEPIADNSTEVGRAKNRRAEFILLKK